VTPIRLRTVFLGSGAFAIPSFEALLDAGHHVLALVSQPDKEKGRGRALAPPPLKPVAEARGIPVLQPRRVRHPEAQAELQRLSPDLQVVVAYGQILPRSVIDIPRLGTVNVHGSLLPRFRGAAPIQWAIASGDTQTGVTTMLIDEGLDTGPVLLARPTPIGPEETASELEARLARLGASVLLETVDGLAAGTLRPRPQDHSQATVARLLEKEDGRIDWKLPAEAIARRVRAFHPWPGAFTRFRGRTLKVLRARAVEAGGAPPGVVARVDGEAIEVGCGGDSRLRLLELQPESRKAMTAAAFAAGARISPGSRFD
jgi:methionyl-tRNA formyltransferase